MIVVDTNVMAYLLIEGERTAACGKVLEADPEWGVPILWRSEFRNVLTMHIRHAEMTVEGALTRMSMAEEIIKNREYVIDSETVLKAAQDWTISAYDAEFVCLADKLGIQLITTDKQLLKLFPKFACSPEDF